MTTRLRQTVLENRASTPKLAANSGSRSGTPNCDAAGVVSVQVQQQDAAVSAANLDTNAKLQVDKSESTDLKSEEANSSMPNAVSTASGCDVREVNMTEQDVTDCTSETADFRQGQVNPEPSTPNCACSAPNLDSGTPHSIYSTPMCTSTAPNGTTGTPNSTYATPNCICGDTPNSIYSTPNCSAGTPQQQPLLTCSDENAKSTSLDDRTSAERPAVSLALDMPNLKPEIMDSAKHGFSNSTETDRNQNTLPVTDVVDSVDTGDESVTQAFVTGVDCVGAS